MFKAVCSECGQDHYWHLLSDLYTYVCGDCVTKPNIGMNQMLGCYYRFAYCTCGERGPVNFHPNIYWCCNHPIDRTL